MLINEVCKATGLTKKAVEYYTEQGLVSPAVLENGYRAFHPCDMERLRKIFVLRKLGVSTQEIRGILDDETGELLCKASVQREVDLQRQRTKKELLSKLSAGADYAEIREAMQSVDGSATVAEKLLEAYPGYYGRFICLHFARFLNMPITTQKQKNAYEKILAFLDSVPAFSFPEELQTYLTENTKHIGAEEISGLIADTKKSIENLDDFLADNKDMLAQYWTFKQSEAYQNSPAAQLESLLIEFNRTSGYYDVLIPAFKELSPAYAEYCKQLEAANEKLLAQYPELKKINDQQGAH